MHFLSPTYIKEKWNHAGFQKYFQSTGWMFAARVLSMAVSFFTTVFVARHLGPENLGQLNYAVSFVGIFSFLASLGIDNVLYRDLIRHPDRKKEFLGSALLLKLAGGIATAVIVVVSAVFFAQNDVSRVLILILSGTFLFNEFQIINFEFQARVKSKYPSIVIFLITIILNLLKILVIVAGKGVIYLAFVLLLEPILYALFYWFIYEKKIEERLFPWKFDAQIARQLLSDSWPLIFTSAFMLVYGRIDQVLIKYMMNASAVGIYSAAVTVAEVWYFIPGIIVSSLFPAIINSKKVSEKFYSARLQKLAFFLFICAVAICLPVTIFAPLAIQILYGKAFLGSVAILRIYVWAAVGTFLGILVDNYLIAENYRGILITRSFVPMIINIILNILWIPKYGIVGSAYATLLSYSLGPLIIFAFHKTRRQIFNPTSQ